MTIKECLENLQEFHTFNDFSKWGDKEGQMLLAVSMAVDILENLNEEMIVESIVNYCAVDKKTYAVTDLERGIAQAIIQDLTEREDYRPKSLDYLVARKMGNSVGKSGVNYDKAGEMCNPIQDLTKENK